VRSTAAEVITTGTLLLAPAAYIVLGPVSAALSIPETRRHEAQERMTYCELPDKALAPGETMFGFVYLRVNKATLERANATLHVRVALTSPRTDESEGFSFEIGSGGR
jgi:hypothetical protein